MLLVLSSTGSYGFRAVSFICWNWKFHYSLII